MSEKDRTYQPRAIVTQYHNFENHRERLVRQLDKFIAESGLPSDPEVLGRMGQQEFFQMVAKAAGAYPLINHAGAERNSWAFLVLTYMLENHFLRIARTRGDIEGVERHALAIGQLLEWWRW